MGCEQGVNRSKVGRAERGCWGLVCCFASVETRPERKNSLTAHGRVRRGEAHCAAPGDLDGDLVVRF